jgi:hypothetical protein
VADDVPDEVADYTPDNSARQMNWQAKFITRYQIVKYWLIVHLKLFMVEVISTIC